MVHVMTSNKNHIPIVQLVPVQPSTQTHPIALSQVPPFIQKHLSEQLIPYVSLKHSV